MSFDPLPGDPNPYPVVTMPGAGAATLYRQASGLEKALADTDAERLIGTHAELIIAQWDPYKISYQNLPYLAYATGVNLWEADWWGEAGKRDWVAQQWLFKSLRGAPAGLRMALAVSGYDITDMVRPPQGFYVSPDLTPDERNRWIRQMPEIRIYWAPREGTRGIDEFYVERDNATDINDMLWFDASIKVAGVGFVGADVISIDDGWALWGRTAIMRQHGVDTPLDVIRYQPGFADASAVDYERVSTVGSAPIGFVLDGDYVEDARFICAEDIEPQLITLRLDETYVKDTSTLGLTTVTSSLTPITPRWERSSDVGNGDGMFFMGADFLSDERFLDHPDGGDRLLADQIYLLDPDVAVYMNEGISFVGDTRLGIAPYTAELQVDLHTEDNANTFYPFDAYIESSFITPEDDSHRERAFRAIVAAKAERDSMLVTFDPVRPYEMGDPLTDASTYDGWVRQSL